MWTCETKSKLKNYNFWMKVIIKMGKKLNVYNDT